MLKYKSKIISQHNTINITIFFLLDKKYIAFC